MPKARSPVLEKSCLQEGKKAPDFTLLSSTGIDITLSDYRGSKNVVLYFYPKDDTPGCTQEACDFRDQMKLFSRNDTVILGVSPDSAASHEKFRKKYKLPFDLLSDESKKLLEKYGVWKEKSLYGRKYMGVERTTVLIDKEGRVARLFQKVKVTGHAGEILKALEALEG